MKEKFIVQKVDGALVPTNQHGQEVMEEDIKGNVEYLIEPKTSRYIKFHQKYWAILREIAKNSDYYHLKDTSNATRDLHMKVKLGVGYVEEIEYNVGGVFVIQKQPKSIDFARMGGLAFDKFYKSAMIWLATQDYLNTEGII